MSIAETIIELRTAKGLSQQELADLTFVSRELVSKWERGTRRPDRPTAEKLAEVLGVPADRITGQSGTVMNELADCFPDGTDKETLIASLNGFLRTETERNADVFVKRYFFAESITEIAGEYGIGENHVRSILSKTRKKLKKHIKEEMK